jgi:hypothetical protein
MSLDEQREQIEGARTDRDGQAITGCVQTEQFPIAAIKAESFK